MKWWCTSLLVLAACGRVGFDPVGAGTDGGGDGPLVTAPGLIVASGAGDEELNDLAIDSDGNVVITGRYTMGVDLGGATATSVAASGGDGFVAVVGLDGVTHYLTTFGATGIGVGLAVAWLSAGDSVTTGYFAGTATRLGSPVGSPQDALVMTLDAAGTVKRLAHFGGTQNTQGRAIDASGSRVVHAGIYMDTFDLGSGAVATATSDNAYLASTDLVGGNPLVRTLNGNGDVYINDVALAPDGSICVGGRFTAATSFGGGQPTSPDVRSAFVARYEPNLSLRWVTTFGRIAEANAVAVASNGDCVAVGQVLDTLTLIDVIVAQGSDGWIARFDGGMGAARWLRALVGPGTEYVWGVATTPDDKIVIAGVSDAVATLAGIGLAYDGGTDGFIAGLAGTGEAKWIQHIGGSGAVNPGIAGVAVDPAGTRVGVAFSFTGELTFEGTAVTATGDDAAAIVIALPP
jgi:hypothetical protein